MHPRWPTLGVVDGDLVTVTSRRGSITLPAHVVNTIRPTRCSSRTTGRRQAANQLTIRAVDPLSNMPEFKVAAYASSARGPRRHDGHPRHGTHGGGDSEVGPLRHRRTPGVRDRPEPMHRLRGVRPGCANAERTAASR
jgi:hypothetical protein